MANPKSKAPLVGAAVIGVILIVLVRLIFNGGGSESPQTPQENPVAQPREGCTSVHVVASSEKAALLQEIAAEYNATSPEVDGTCVDVSVGSKASGAAAEALARGWDENVDGERPDVWSPAATSWLRISGQKAASFDNPNVVPTNGPSIAQSPLVIAMPRPMAEALGWPKKAIGWNDLVALTSDPAGWGKHGHPEWGAFKLGKTNPEFSTSGLHATVGTYFAATGVSSDLSLANVADPKVAEYVKKVESSVVHYGDTTLTFLSNLQEAAETGKGLSYISAVTLEEKSVLDYNLGNPTGDPKTLGEKPAPEIPLAAVYPAEGTLVSDSPYAVLTAPWVDAVKKEGAAGFLTYLQGEDAQKRFQEAGFRSFEGEGGGAIKPENGLLPAEPKVVLTPPGAEVLTKVEASWSDLRKKARALLVIDVSGSMGEPVPSAGTNKLELAKKAALNALNQFHPEDEVGLRIFSTERTPTSPYLDLVPVGPVGVNLDELRERISGLTPDGGTALYATARASTQKMRDEYDPARINAVVFLTDGRNEYPADTNLESLLQELNSSSETNQVRLFTIGYGADADLQTLEEMAAATNAAAYDASDPSTIDKVFTDVISNF